MIYIGSDHAGYKTKEVVKKALAKEGIELLDVGTFSEQSTDYPKIASEVAKAVVADKTQGILICGTGTGMAIAANKIKGARAAFAHDEYAARMAREDNNANILALRGRKFSARTAAKLAKTFLKAQFSDQSRHKRRVSQIARLER